MPSNPVRVSNEQPTVAPGVLTEALEVHRYEAEDHAVVNRMRLLMVQRAFLFRVTAYGLALATLLAFLIPVQYESRAQLMPPDSQSGQGLASLLGMAAKAGSGLGMLAGDGLGMLAGDLLGLKESGSLFIGILRSRTVEDRIVDKFD